LVTTEILVRVLLFVWSAGSLIAEYGFGGSPSSRLPLYHYLDVAFLITLGGYVFVHTVFGHGEWLSRNILIFVLGFCGVLGVVATSGVVFAIWAAAVKFCVALALLTRAAASLIPRLKMTTPLVVVASFVLIITTGWILLMLPAASAHQQPISPVNALFTATSATCVTGLVVLDTGSDFSLFGQIVILALIQIGGLGLMTFVAFFALTVGTGLSLREQFIMQEALSLGGLSHLRQMLRFIVISTFAIEAVGALLIFLSFPFPANWSASYRVYFSVFHAISAFCNAGFSLLSDSLACARASVPINAIFLALILIGGFGFAVNYRIWLHMRRLLGARSRAGMLFRLHSRLVLITSAVLVASGALLIYLFERSNSFLTYSGGEAALASLFQSVSARTAGFNTTDIGSMSLPTLCLIMVLMFIGASPGSTGGGIKTTTFAIFVLLIANRLRNRADVELMRRRIPQHLIETSLIIIIVAAALVVLCTLLLSFFGLDPQAVQQHPEVMRKFAAKPLACFAFEVVSAFATVGYSTGITPLLSTGAKIVLSICMLVGRIGPFTMLLALSKQRPKTRYSYPSEGIIVG